MSDEHVAALVEAEDPALRLTAWLNATLLGRGLKVESREHALLVTLPDKREIMVGIRMV